jgi:hypothetical protein
MPVIGADRLCVKVKLSLCLIKRHAMKTYREWMTAPRFGRFTIGILYVGHQSKTDMEPVADINIPVPAGNRTPVAYPIASRYTH